MGDSIWFNNRRWLIKSVEQMQEFMTTMKQDQKEGQQSQEKQNGAQLY